ARARGLPRTRRQELDEAHARLVRRRHRQGHHRLPPGACLHADQRDRLHRAEGSCLLVSAETRILMVELTLPKNSRINEGKVWPKPAGAKELREYRIYRWNPDDGENPRIDTYYVDIADSGPMILGQPLWI